MVIIKGKRGQEREWVINWVIGGVFLLIILGGVLYVSSSGGKVLAEINREDLDTKLSFGCNPAYKEGSFEAKVSFCQKFDPIGGSLLFGSNNFISCQYRPAVEIMLQNGAIGAADLTAAVKLINNFCATDLITNAKDGDELAFATKFCTTEKARANNFKDGLWVNGFIGLWVNGFIFDKECKITTYPDWYPAPAEDINSNGSTTKIVTLLGFTYTIDITNGKMAGSDGINWNWNQADKTWTQDLGSNSGPPQTIDAKIDTQFDISGQFE
ncbi:hypothetical protein J4205_00140 [Candidatus Pacearchaeota archaeon]|nr:hypothetical protein [Candidatus Pacearchaeota archaeon]